MCKRAHQLLKTNGLLLIITPDSNCVNKSVFFIFFKIDLSSSVSSSTEELILHSSGVKLFSKSGFSESTIPNHLIFITLLSAKFLQPSCGTEGNLLKIISLFLIFLKIQFYEEIESSSMNLRLILEPNESLQSTDSVII